MSAAEPGELKVQSEGDIVLARRAVRDVALQLGFGATDVTRIVTASSELARNMVKYAGTGVMRWRGLDTQSLPGLEIQFEDRGPGIADVEQALQEGYSSGNGLGMGLPGAKRLMDEMNIQSALGQGTTVTVRKWRRS